jgi:hypothetical protein
VPQRPAGALVPSSAAATASSAFLDRQPHQRCSPELRELCDQLEERVDLYASQLYANQGLGAPLDYARVNWTAVEQYIATNNFRVEDYSLVPPLFFVFTTARRPS